MTTLVLPPSLDAAAAQEFWFFLVVPTVVYQKKAKMHTESRGEHVDNLVSNFHVGGSDGKGRKDVAILREGMRRVVQLH